jgi:UDP-N-acetylglucosamine--N-acetylmuramyl-(pentapeptide) pyrophosphoryl-undecaprenol N-acetylglucosamine transferase
MSGVSFRAYKKVILVGGGTGGHVTPIVSLVKEHKDTTIQFLWIGGRDSLEEKEAFKENIPFERISTLKLSTVFSPKIILFPFVLLKSIFEARKILLRESPNLVFSKG